MEAPGFFTATRVLMCGFIIWNAGENNDGGGLCSLAYAVVSGVSGKTVESHARDS